MQQVKKLMGIIWILLGPVAIYYLVRTALREIQKNPMIDTKIQWGVFVIVFIPIAIGMVIFGYYAVKGEYTVLRSAPGEI